MIRSGVLTAEARKAEASDSELVLESSITWTVLLERVLERVERLLVGTDEEEGDGEGDDSTIVDILGIGMTGYWSSLSTPASKK